MTARLELEEVVVSYGSTEVVHGMSLRVEEGEMVALLGANGAGKTSTLRAISNIGVRIRGSLRFEGRDLASVPAPDIARLGIAHVPEGRGTFSDLTVDENLRVGAIQRRDAAGVQDDIDRVKELFPKLASRSTQLAGTLSGGEQQMLAIARALMMRPKLLLLDEPSFGIAPMVTQEIYSLLQGLREKEGLTALLVEQNADLALSIANRAYILESGRVVMEGSSGELRENEAVKRSYLGY